MAKIIVFDSDEMRLRRIQATTEEIKYENECISRMIEENRKASEAIEVERERIRALRKKRGY